jgi:NhaP-type Na+/H+ or K+/H+ antiporter
VAVAWIVTALDRFLICPGFDDPPTQIMLLALLHFAVYLVANQFGLSGILTEVSADVTPKSAIDIWHPAESGRATKAPLISPFSAQVMCLNFGLFKQKKGPA